MARRRNESVALNFDGLTDAVTNLTGTLILLVVLIFGITSEATVPEPPPPPPSPETHEGKPIGPLLQKIDRLKLEIQQVDREIQALQDDLPRLQQEVDQLRQQTESAEPGDTPPPADAGKGLQVDGRPAGGHRPV